MTTRVRLDALVARTGARLRVLGTLAIDHAEQVLELIAGTPADGPDRELRRRLARLCGHLPLALRIVGARPAGGPQWSVVDLVTELTDERRRLSALDLEDPTTSLRAALDVTFRSLDKELADTVCLLGLFLGNRIGPYPVAAMCGIDVNTARQRLRALAASFMVTETSREVFLMHDLVRLHATEPAATELTDVYKTGARQRLLRYYLVGADLARRQPGTGAGDEPSMADRFPDTPHAPVNTPREAADWIEHEWTNLLAVVDIALDTEQNEEIVLLARMASEFAEGTTRAPTSAVMTNDTPVQPRVG